MRRALLSFVPVLCSGLFVASLVAQDPAPAAPAAPKRLAFADTLRPLAWQTDVPRVRWADDRRLVEIGDGKERRYFDPAARAAAAAPARPVRAAMPRKLLRLHQGDLWLDESPAELPAEPPSGPERRRRDDEPGERALRLTEDGDAGGAKLEFQLAPEGRFVSYVQGNDLVVVDTATRTPWRVTSDGSEELLHGRLDWVYQEELYGRGDFQGHWWSPRGDLCAFLSLDQAAVREFTVIDHVPDGFLDRERSVVAEVTNYPKAGDPNPTARLSIAHAGAQRVVAADFSAMPADLLVVRVDWTPDGSKVLATLQDRVQTWAELVAIDPATGAVQRWIREESPTWVNRPDSPRWLADGTFLWLSERTGYQHVYRYEQGGRLLGAVTKGDWQVRSIVRVDESKGRLWFEGTKDGATGRHLYRVDFDGENLVFLTPGVGTHQFELRDDGAFVLDRWSAMDLPPVVRLLDGESGEVVHELARAERGGAADSYGLCERQRVTIPARDGYELDACVQLPTGYQEGRRYPVFLPTYSGPDAPTVRDSWSHSSYHQFLGQQGFVVLQVNVRSASGRGQVHTGTCYQRLGVQELMDLEDAVDHVVAHFGGDPKRVAISGWSYGGFMAAYALTHSDKFALGLAGAGVYDWRLYDTIYTERYMRTPQQNAAGYAETSVIKAAANLRGQLVLIHGSMDDNVHLQNTMQLLWALQTAGKQNVELMVYPRSRHGLDRRVRDHSQEFQWLRLARLLAADGR